MVQVEHAAGNGRLWLSAVIAPSFADIFRSNALKNGICLSLSASEVDLLLRRLTLMKVPAQVDLETCLITLPDGAVWILVDARRDCLMKDLTTSGSPQEYERDQIL